MSIILPHTTSDIQFYRSNGVCYRRTDWGVEGTPNTSWDAVVDTPYNDFGTYGSCSACQDAASVPPTCPCSISTFNSLGTGVITECGYAGDPIYKDYRINMSNFQPCPGACIYLLSEDQPELYNIVSALSSGQCGWSWYSGAMNATSPVRIPNTLYGPIVVSNVTTAAQIHLSFYPGAAWVFYFSISYYQGCSSYYIWKKTTGVTPAGVYTALSCGETATFMPGQPVNQALAPSSILVEAIIP